MEVGHQPVMPDEVLSDETAFAQLIDGIGI